MINCLKLRIHALPTRARTAKKRPEKDKFNNVLQNSPRTHSTTIQRHNHLVDYISRSLRERNYEVHTEPIIRSAPTIKKTDIIALKIPSVITDSFSVERAHAEKKKKHIEEEFKQIVRDSYNKLAVTTNTITLNWQEFGDPPPEKKPPA